MPFNVTGPVYVYVGLGASLQPRGDLLPLLNRDSALAGTSQDPNTVGAGQPVGNVQQLPFTVVTGEPVFLGTAERCPRFSLQPYWVPVRRDDYGSSVPWDLLYDSEEAWIYAELNYFSERVLEAVQDRMYVSGSPFPLRGFHTEDAVGTLARGENKTYNLILSFPYARKLINALGGMPANFVFPTCVSWGPDDHDIQGTHQPRQVRLLWRALRQHNTEVIGDNEEVDVPAVFPGESILYYHDPFLVLPPPVG